MQYLFLTLSTPEENLALDEALLDAAEAGQIGEVLRFWEPTKPMVVLGRSSRIVAEVHSKACQQQKMPVFRRSSGGASILTGPGCLMYALVLNYASKPYLTSIEETHSLVLNRHVDALSPILSNLSRQGTSDLVVMDHHQKVRKFSGNSLRCKRHHLLYHGTILYNFPIEQMDQYLKLPPRQPHYRQGRGHDMFLTNIPLAAPVIFQAIRDIWEAHDSSRFWPDQLVTNLVETKYRQSAWNQQFP